MVRTVTNEELLVRTDEKAKRSTARESQFPTPAPTLDFESMHKITVSLSGCGENNKSEE
jgi:hypothetical protein